MNEKQKSLKRGEKAAAVTALISLALALGKGVAGLMSGSVVLISDALHSGTDLVAGAAAWFGLKIAQREPDEKFPYGYFKAENLAALTVSIVILYAAIETLYNGYLALFLPSNIEMPLIALGVAGVSIIASFWNERYLKKIGEETKSDSLKANADDKKVDILASGIVFIAILLSYFSVPYVEGAITIAISLMILKIGFENARDSVFALMDVGASKEVESRVTRIVSSVPNVAGIGNIMLRKAGPFIFGEIIIKIKKNIDVQRAHAISDRIEKRVMNAIPEVERISIHIEPFKTVEQKIAIPVEEDNGLESIALGKFGRAKKFIFVTINSDSGEIVEHYCKKNPFTKKNVKAGLDASNLICKEKADALVTSNLGEISFHTIRDHFVDIYFLKGKTVEEVAKNFAGGKLERLDKHTKKGDGLNE